MVEVPSGVLDATFQALAHPTRRRMLQLLAREQRTVGDLAEEFDVSLAASSKHLQVLERAGLVARTVEGRRHRVRLEPERLAAAVDWTERCRATWRDNFARLDAVLRSARPSRRQRE